MHQNQGPAEQVQMDYGQALEGESEWQELQAPGDGRSSRSFVSGDPGGDRLRVRYYRTPSGNLTARVWFGPGSQGPPGHAHGGCLAAILDESMGAAAWLAGHTVLAVRISVDFRSMVPLGSVAAVETRIEGVQGRKVQVRGAILNLAGEVLAEGEGLFLTVEPEKLGGLSAASLLGRDTAPP